MKKDKAFQKRGAFAGVDYRIHYFPDDDVMSGSVAVELECLSRKFRIDVYRHDLKHTRKFIRALKKGLRRLKHGIRD